MALNLGTSQTLHQTAEYGYRVEPRRGRELSAPFRSAHSTGSAYDASEVTPLLSRSLGTLVALSLALTAAPAAGDVPYRTVVVFGDTQYMVQDGFTAYFEAMVRWVVESAVTENIDFVVQVGDAVQSGVACDPSPEHAPEEDCAPETQALLDKQWATFTRVWEPIETAGIPFAIVRGNHDDRAGYDQHYGRERFQSLAENVWANASPAAALVLSCDRNTPAADDPEGVCEAANDTGHVWRFHLGGDHPQEVLVAGMPFDPSDGMRAWYREALQRWPETPAVIVSHSHLLRTPGSIFHELVEGPYGIGRPLTEQVFMTVEGHLNADVKQIVEVEGHRSLRVHFDKQQWQKEPDWNPIKGAAIALIRFHLDEGGIDRVEGKTLEPFMFPTGGAPVLDPAGDFGPFPFSIHRDTDHDGVADANDNCDTIPSEDQVDSDDDGAGDLCDLDVDGDGIPGAVDFDDTTPMDCCDPADTAAHPNYCDGDFAAPAGELDDADRRALMECIGGAETGCETADMNYDGMLDGGDYLVFARLCGERCDDFDSDGVPNGEDNCRSVVNPSQADHDQDGIGDACDNCTDAPNGPAANTAGENQWDTDASGIFGFALDGFGDVCQGIGPSAFEGEAVLAELQGLGDSDGDGIANARDNCVTIANPEQADDDRDGFGNPCQWIADLGFAPSSLQCVRAVGSCPRIDTDRDRIPDDLDNCPFVANFLVEDPEGNLAQLDSDGDGVGDACECNFAWGSLLDRRDRGQGEVRGCPPVPHIALEASARARGAVRQSHPPTRRACPRLPTPRQGADAAHVPQGPTR